VAHSRAERWAFGLLNRLHIESRPGTIRRRLQFGEGDSIGKGALTESEKVLRSEDFLSDAVVEVGPERDGTRDIKVTSFDQWTTAAGGGVDIENFKPADLYRGRWDRVGDWEWKWWVGAWESNLLGTGTKLGGSFRRDLEREMREVVLSNSSVSRHALQLGAYAAWLSDGHALQLKAAKPLLSRQDRFAFSAHLSSLQLSEFLYFDANRLEGIPDSLAGARAGEAHIVREFRRVTTDSLHLSATRSFGSRLKINAGPTFFRLERYQRGGSDNADPALLEAAPLPASADAPRLRSEALLGAALSVYQYDYKTARNFRNLKWNESVETGWRLTLEAAMNQEWLGAGDSDFRLVQKASFGEAWRDTWYAACSLSADYFVSPSGAFRDGRVDASLEAQWKPAAITSTSLAASWSHLFAAPASARLTLGALEGLSGYPSYYFSGQARFLGILEQRLFPEFELATLVPAFSAYLAAGNTFPAYRDFDPGALHYSIGLGLRLGKSKSTTKGVQHINVSWPLGDPRLSGPAISILAKKSL
jgi:hypothetical protein